MPRIVAVALFLLASPVLLASPAHALRCGGGSAFLETDIGGYCLEAETGMLDAEALARVEAVAMGRSGGYLREVAAEVAGEQHLRAGRWSEADRFFSRSLQVNPRDAEPVRASRAVARLRSGDRRGAARDAEQVITRVCDRWTRSRDASFDEITSCRRAILVATELATTDEARATLRDRWRRFARERPLHDEADARAYALAACVVRSATPCTATIEPPDPERGLSSLWQGCIASDASTAPACFCAAVTRAPPPEMAVEEGGYREFVGLHAHEYTDILLEVDARGAVLTCTIDPWS